MFRAFGFEAYPNLAATSKMDRVRLAVDHVLGTWSLNNASNHERCPLSLIHLPGRTVIARIVRPADHGKNLGCDNMERGPGTSPDSNELKHLNLVEHAMLRGDALY